MKKELLRFVWEGFASPVTIGLGVNLLVLREAGADTTVIARLRERPSTLVPYLDGIARQLDGSCLPLEVRNYAPELLPVDVVRDLYEQVDWCGDEDVVSASDLLDRLDGPAARAHARRWLPPRRSLREAIARLEVVCDDHGDHEVADRRLLRDLHFALTYEERP